MITAKFAFYWEFGDPIPSYLVIKSNNKSLPVGGNVDKSTIRKHGYEIPETPSYLDWVKNGRQIYRGEGDIR